jgi:hypothetical protein
MNMNDYYELRDKLQAKLKQVGLPYKSIDILGDRIIITCLSENTIDKWVDAIHPAIAKYKGVIETIDYAKKNQNTVLLPSTIKVWRAWFII